MSVDSNSTKACFGPAVAITALNLMVESCHVDYEASENFKKCKMEKCKKGIREEDGMVHYLQLATVILVYGKEMCVLCVCSRQCQMRHWRTHKNVCQFRRLPTGVPYVLSLPKSKLTFKRLAKLAEFYSR